MKFRNGAWHWFDNVDAHIMRQMQEYRLAGSTLFLAVADREGRATSKPTSSNSASPPPPRRHPRPSRTPFAPLRRRPRL